MGKKFSCRECFTGADCQSTGDRVPCGSASLPDNGEKFFCGACMEGVGGCGGGVGVRRK